MRCNSEDTTFEHLISQGLSKSAAMTVLKLAAILRISNALDKTHKQKCSEMKVSLEEKELRITVYSYEDLTIERGLFPEKTFLFEQAYGVKPVIKVKHH